MFSTKADKFPGTVEVYHNDIFMGIFRNVSNVMEFQQYSNDGCIYSKDLAKEFMIEQGANPDTIKCHDGRSTKTQVWFRLTATK